MRLSLGRSLCLLALAACADSTAITAHPPDDTHSRHAPGGANDAGPTATLTPNAAELAPAMTRMEWLFGGNIARVALPPDEYSRSADAVHPDISCPGAAWNARRCWLMYTPYHNGDNNYENPGLLFAASDTLWATPPDIHNPLVPYPGPARYNSDPDHVFDPATGRMVQVYRVVADASNYIMLMSTADAVHWTKPVVAFREPMHDAVSPALVIDGDRRARMWYVQAGRLGCDAGSSTVALRTAMPGPDSTYEHATWSAPVAVTMTIPKYIIWHLDVMPLSANRGFLALIAAFPRGANCANSDLWIAWSGDGVQWTTYAIPILWRTMQAARARRIDTWYRGTMYEDSTAGRLHLWPSALAQGAWTIYHTSVKLDDLLALLRSAQPADFQPALLAKTNRTRVVEMP
ncbi:MAG TPA: hypothetical protein VHB25_16980 [Gemmatimonadaceae bacterium]|nr:hypothetical protein [Gemmatimonadaceae bacterium]